MAEIVLGAAASHTPLLTFGVDLWLARAEDDKRRPNHALSDGRTISYQELLEEVGGKYAEDAKPESLQKLAEAGQAALDQLADALAAAKPDVVVIIGDDQSELFNLSHMPAIAVFHGEEIIMHPRGEVLKDMPDWRRASTHGYAMDAAHHFPAARALGLHVIREFIKADIDVGAVDAVRDPKKAGFGHAFGFIIKRLMREAPIPVLPVLVNTYFPPNVPTAARCYRYGQVLAQALRSAPGDLRIAVVASGGLSHFVTDATLDRSVIDAILNDTTESLRDIPMHALRSGSSEILNWIAAAGALEALPKRWAEYYPVYRTPAGTGCGLGFATWSA